MAAREIAGDTGLGRNLNTASDLDVIGDADLAAHNDEITNLDAAGKANFSRQYAVPSEARVVPNLDQIINLGALPDNGVGQSAAIDAAICANFDPSWMMTRPSWGILKCPAADPI